MDNEKRFLTVGQYAWAVGGKDATFKLIVGPDPLDLTEDDVYVASDPRNLTGVIPVEKSDAISDFVTLKPDQYAVIHNPARQGVNGKYQAGKNLMSESLDYGKKKVVIDGHFPIWPGQIVDVRCIHHLSSSQYLVAIVEDVNVDVDSPYYELTRACAKITQAIVEETTAKELADEIDSSSAEDVEESDEAVGETVGESADSGSPVLPVAKESPADGIFKVGQKIVIPGNITPTYVPPTGIEVIDETGTLSTTGHEQSNDVGLTYDQAEDLIARSISSGRLTFSNIREYLGRVGIEGQYYTIEEKYYAKQPSSSDSSQAKARIFKQALFETIGVEDSIRLAELFQDSAPFVLEERVSLPSSDQAVREAVVLNPTEFCVLIDEDGRFQTKRGPGRVFPGPNDRFRIVHSRNRVYDAYHIRSDRGLLLRVVAEDISKRELIGQLPVGSEDHLEKDLYLKGDEMFIGGFDAYLVPSNSIEVIDPVLRTPHIGNDHSSIYVQAVGVDQKSGVYVADVETGSVGLVCGETKLLLDPRRQIHTKRNIPGRMWNLMIGKGEPHKCVDSSMMVSTPWALSVIIPNNEAVLVTSKDGCRPVVGPRTELLEYEEWLEVLTLSRGRPKDDRDRLETSFLRVTGSRISDQIILETRDFVTMVIDVSYGVSFVGESDEEKAKWFVFKDYIKLLTTSCRSRLRSAAKKQSLNELRPMVSDFVRDVILGEKPSDGAKRSGLLFEENNLLVEEIDLLSVNIPDEELAELLEETNRAVVTRQMQDAQRLAELDSNKLRDGIDSEEVLLRQNQSDREKDLSLSQTANRIEMLEKQLEVDLADQSRLDQINSATIARRNVLHNLEIRLDGEKKKLSVSFWESIAGVRAGILDKETSSLVARLEAIQPGLIEAIDGLGDKQVLTELAKSLPQSTGELGILLGGLGGLKSVATLFAGTEIERAIHKLSPGIGSNGANDLGDDLVVSESEMGATD